MYSLSRRLLTWVSVALAIFLADFTYRLLTAESKFDYFFRQFGWADLLASLPFEQVKEQVRQALAIERAGKVAEAEAKALVARLEKGETLQQVSESLARPIVPVLGVSRQTPVPQLQPVVAEAFRLAKPSQGKAGGSGYAVMPDGGYIVMQVESIVEPDTALLDPAARSSAALRLGQIRADQQASEYIRSLRKSMQIDIVEERL